MAEVIDRGDELIRPVAFAIANGDIAALGRGDLDLRAQQQVVKFLRAWLDPQSPRHVIFECEAPLATRAGVPKLVTDGGLVFGSSDGGRVFRPGGRDLATAARTSVQQTTVGQRPSRCFVDVMAIALAAVAAAGPKRACRIDIRHEPEPVEVFEDRRFVLGLAALAVVVFDAKKNPGARSAGEIPDVVGIQDVAEVQISRRCGRETREARRSQDFAAFPARRNTACRLTGFVFRNGAHLSSLA